MKKSYSILILVQFLCFSLSLGGDTISVNVSVSSGQTIMSSGGNFELGFFRPGDSRSYYIGIWYKKLYPQEVVWVANRDKPLDSADANLIISRGNLVLVDRLQNSIWSALAGNINPNISVTALLRDDGNLILNDVSKASMPLLLWQSFDYPTHTFLPGAKIGYDKRTQRKQLLISWKNLSDPAPGLYSMEMDPTRAQIVVKWNRTREYWASGSWDGRTFSLVPEMRTNYIYNFSYIDNENESYFTYSLNNSSLTSKWMMDVSGLIKQQVWFYGNIDWNL
uniref:Bulb-type lectin domain-containing protein n=2 Tax=Solanum lycopersicum TaxID=4081 RepID=A0A3Q7H5I4_SOLLC